MRPASSAVAVGSRNTPGAGDSGATAESRRGRTDRLLRTGHLLTASSLASSGLGAGYWVFVARWYSAADVGRGYSTVSAMMFLAGFGQLNLANTLVRFVPSAGRGTLHLVRRVYLVAAAATALLATVFVIGVQRFSPQLDFLHNPVSGVGFVLSAAGYAVFVIQDGALTGLLRADWVLYENAIFAVAKIVFVVGLAGFAASQGILVSWYASLAVALTVTNWFLFNHAIPRRTASAEPLGAGAGSAAGKPTFGYLGADFAGSMCWLVATTLMPVFVLDRLGASQSAYFSLAWMVAYTLYQLSTNMGSSLIVEAAGDATRLSADCRRILRHTGLLLGAGVAAGVAAAPWILRIFGPGYVASATGLLRLLLLSAIPNLYVTAAVAVCRARRRVGAAVVILSAVCGGTLVLTFLLLPRIGIAGAGYGWLAAQSAVAAVLLARNSWWLGPAPGGRRVSRYRHGADMVQAAALRARRICAWPGDRVAAYRLARALGPADAAGGVWRAWACALRAVRTASDLLVVQVSREERMAVKCARTELVRLTLGRQQSVLAALHADERLGSWRRLLPCVVACDLEASPPWKVESWLPGVSGATLLRRRPAAAERLTKAALEAIEDLHRATGRRERVDATHLARWVDEPIAMLRHRLRPYRQDGYEASLAALRERLHRQLHGRELSIGWVHRDYHPGNVLYTREGRHVSGIVDWGGAVPDGPTELDLRLFGLAVARQTGRRMFGELVIEALRDGDDGLLLLAWLWHVTDNLDKSARFVASRLWTGRNILDVLEAVNQ